MLEKGRSVLVYPGGDPIDDNPNETWSSAIYLTCSKGRKKVRVLRTIETIKSLTFPSSIERANVDR